MQGKASVFSGQSGVGKSSLINAIAHLDLPVGELVQATGKGSHVTTTAQLLPLEGGGWCIDTPGIKSFGIWELTQEDLRHHYLELAQEGRGCRYPDCTHTHEPNCAVIEALNKNRLSALRYASYRSLLEEVQGSHRRR
jgi:ribosome biogenesis GTPase